MSDWMQVALEQAQLAADANEVPVGAVIVKNSTLISVAHNLVETNHDISSHAEILAIRAASKQLESPRLIDCDLYVTLEPCPMCAQAISFARIRRLYFGAFDAKGGGVEHGPRIFQQPTCHHAPDLISGLQEQACGDILRCFFAAKR